MTMEKRPKHRPVASMPDDALRQYLRRYLRYDPADGNFYYTSSPPRSRAKVGSVAGRVWNRGYRVIVIQETEFPAHRLVWFIHHGCWPSQLIDHINGDRCDNRLANLREATHSQNQANKAWMPNNTSGFKGVSAGSGGKFRAQIHIAGKQHYLGTFKTGQEAHAAYCEAAAKLFGEYARTNSNG